MFNVVMIYMLILELASELTLNVLTHDATIIYGLPVLIRAQMQRRK